MPIALLGNIIGAIFNSVKDSSELENQIIQHQLNQLEPPDYPPPYPSSTYFPSSFFPVSGSFSGFTPEEDTALMKNTILDLPRKEKIGDDPKVGQARDIDLD